MNAAKKNEDLNSNNKETVEINNNTNILTILLADEISVLRQTQRALFESQPDLKVIGEVNNGLDALDSVGFLHPDILLLGLRASNVLEIIQLINQRYPNTGVIVPYKPENESNGLEILRAGLKACILRTASPFDLIRAVRQWGQNKFHLGSPVLKENRDDSAKPDTKSTIDSLEVLTSREREVFTLVTQGLTNAEIAVKLCISRRTVEVHRSNLLRKLGLRTQQEQLLKYANERDIKL